MYQELDETKTCMLPVMSICMVLLLIMPVLVVLLSYPATKTSSQSSENKINLAHHCQCWENWNLDRSRLLKLDSRLLS